MKLGNIGENIPAEWEAPLLVELVNPKQWKTISTTDLISEGFVVYGANGKIGFYSEFTHEKPTLMITCRGATCGNLHVSEPYSYINGNAMALDDQPTELIGLNFLLHVLKARGLEDTISGSAQPQITRQGLGEVRVPLPPLAEQKVIAEKLDALLAQVEITKARLERIPEIIKRFRQSVLAAAVSGRLTEEWRDAQSDSHNEWRWVTLGEIADIKGGITKDSNKQDSTFIELPYLRVANVQRYYLNLTEVKTIRIPQNKVEELLLEHGDILFNEGGDLDKLGRGWIWEGQIEKCSYQNHVFRARLNDRSDSPKYVSWWGNTEGFEYFIRNGKQTTNLASINKKLLSNLPINMPPNKEQTEIVRRVEQLFAFADTIEQKANAALERVNNLAQSVLAKAFRGELTADWRAANPDLISGENSAEALLERIKAEKASATKKHARRS